MAIGVYRIYVGSTWPDAEADRLARGFDSIAGFLYRIDRPLTDPADPATDAVDDSVRRSLIRISMTHAHAVLVLDSGESAVAADLATEIDLARNGFRRRLPVIEVSPPELAALPLRDGIDVRVGWEPTDIACAVQQSVEQCVADWRALTRSQLSPHPRRELPSQSPPTGPGTVPSKGILPVAEITAAYEDLRARRDEGKQPR